MAAGAASPNEYYQFFNIADSIPIPGGGFGYILFDIDDTINLLSAEFNVTLSAIGADGLYSNSPDVDAMGHIGNQSDASLNECQVSLDICIQEQSSCQSDLIDCGTDLYSSLFI